ncbi:unnamed protein product [Cyprideis torosa]|uniref:Uncharacterized protein n=1 Tax=Cyprideis torosa TaxID=163714 RepID=A0A7R8ZS87_9CRUS|nr:unnamed protein product [Cyprideis torosa]CAG0905322.1 unnamed protein product [Cyprideis torosa]
MVPAELAPAQLGSRVKINDVIRPACLPEREFEYTNGDTVKVIGWGITEVGGPKSTVLNEVEIPLVSAETCAASYSRVRNFPFRDSKLPAEIICAGGTDGKDSCNGDSGGPLFFDLSRGTGLNREYLLVGIVSTGVNCGTDIPAIYTRVEDYFHWILDKLSL